MRAVIAVVLLLIVGQASSSDQLISVQHDSSRSVTCWITPQGGISCLPDSSLPQQAATTAAPEDEAARASLAFSPGDTGASTAAPLPQDERFKL